MKGLSAEVNSLPLGTFRNVDWFHVNSDAHMISLAATEYMAHVHKKIRVVRKLVAEMRSSFKGGDLFEIVKNNLDIISN